MTTADSVSVTRLGETIKLDDFWATLAVYIPSGDNNEQIVADSLNTMYPNIHYSERDFVGEFTSVPDDDFYSGYQKSLHDINSGIKVEEAWDIEVGQDYVKIGVIDGLIDWGHEDYGDGTFAGSKIAGGWDFVNNILVENSQVVNHKHGTQTSGIIGALRFNGVGVAGIAGGDMQNSNTGCQIFSLAIPLGVAYGYVVIHSIAAPAIVEGAAYNPNTGYGYGLHIQNHSWSTPDSSQVLKNAVNSCWRNHCVFVAGRGNNGNAIEGYPACYSDNEVLSVGASGNDGEYKNSLNGFSSYSSSFGHDVDFIAPGSHDIVMSTYNPLISAPYFQDVNCLQNTSNYKCFAGTSASAPHVSGVAALMYSKHHTVNNKPNNLATEDIEHIIQNTATDIYGPTINPDILTSTYPVGYDDYNGWGRVNAFEAVKAVDYPFYVKHCSNAATPVMTQEGYNTPINLEKNINGVPAGYYHANKYKLSWHYVEVLPTTAEIIDWWSLNASTIKGLPDAYNNDCEPYMEVIPNITFGNNWATVDVSTYLYYILNDGFTGYQINTWIPDVPANLKYTFSLHVKDLAATNVKENKENNISLYPNPSSNIVNINFDYSINENTKLVVYDMYGKEVMNMDLENFDTGTNAMSINMSNLSSGIYNIHIKSDKATITKSFVKN